MKRATVIFGRCLRESGQALDRLGMRTLVDNSFKEKFSRHRQLMNILDKKPEVASDAWVAPNATVVGDVEISNDASVWYNCVIRGDSNKVTIGWQTNVQDGTVINSSKENTPGLPNGTSIGNRVSIGNGCTLFSCTIEDECKIGMGSIILNGALVEKNSILAPGTVVPPGRRIPSGQMWAGNPATYVEDVSDDAVNDMIVQADKIKNLARTHSEEFLPYGTLYQEAEKVKAAGGSM